MGRSPVSKLPTSGLSIGLPPAGWLGGRGTASWNLRNFVGMVLKIGGKIKKINMLQEEIVEGIYFLANI